MDLMATAQLLGSFGEFFGSIVVFVTVIYLAAQVRQTKLSVQSASWQNGVDRIIDWNFRVAENGELLDVFQKGMSDPDGLTSRERLRFALMVASFIQQFHKWYLDNEKGLVEEKAWMGEAESMIALLSSPGGARWWRGFKVPFTPEFRAYVDERLEKSRISGGFRYDFDDPFAESSMLSSEHDPGTT